MPEMNVKYARTESLQLILKVFSSEAYTKVSYNKLKSAKPSQDAKEMHTDLHEMLVYPFCKCFLLNFVPFIWKGGEKIQKKVSKNPEETFIIIMQIKKSKMFKRYCLVHLNFLAKLWHREVWKTSS